MQIFGRENLQFFFQKTPFLKCLQNLYFIVFKQKIVNSFAFLDRFSMDDELKEETNILKEETITSNIYVKSNICLLSVCNFVLNF